MVNKKLMEYYPGISVYEALRKSGLLEFNLMVVYVNEEVLRGKARYRKKILKDGDKITAIDYMGGG